MQLHMAELLGCVLLLTFAIADPALYRIESNISLPFELDSTASVTGMTDSLVAIRRGKSLTILNLTTNTIQQ